MISRFTITMTFLLLSVSSTIVTAVPAPQTGKQNAEQLVRSAQKSVAKVVKTARGESKLKQNSADAKPFWEAMKRANESLSKAETGLALKDNTFFTSLAETGAAVQQAEVALEMIEPNNSALTKDVLTLAAVVDALIGKYGKEAARLKQGGTLTAAEKAQLEKLKAQQKDLDKKLAQVEKKVAKNNRKIQKQLKRIRENQRRIRDSGSGVADFVGAVIAARIISGWIWGCHWWWGPWGAWGPDFVNINIDIWYDSVDIIAYDWDLVDDYVDVASLDLDDMAIGDEELSLQDEFLEQGDFGLQEGDLAELTDEVPQGWDEVETAAGAEVMDHYQENFEAPIMAPEPSYDTFDSVGPGDFGGDFGGDIGGDW